MTSRVFVGIFSAKTPEGVSALERMMSAKVSSAFEKSQKALGIEKARRIVSQEPYILELEFKLTKAAGLAYRKQRKHSMAHWVEDFDDKMLEFDQVEQVNRDVDYVLVWEDRTL